MTDDDADTEADGVTDGDADIMMGMLWLMEMETLTSMGPIV